MMNGQTSWPANLPARQLSFINLGDLLSRWICQAAAWLVILLAILLLVVLLLGSWLSLQTNGLSFFLTDVWKPQEDRRVFGAVAFLYGTLVSSALAMLIAVPLGVGAAAFLAEIASPWLRRIGSFLIEMLATVPSVVYGFWGMFVLGPAIHNLVTWLGGPSIGNVGILQAGIILAIMIVPYITAVSFDVCRAVPSSQREASLALGATRWQTIWSVVLPYARPGIVGACFIALGRAVGETMAVTMLIGNTPVIQFSIFARGDTIASAIANQFPAATYDLYRSALVELGLVLFLVTIIINALARVLIRQVGKPGRGNGILSLRLFFRKTSPIQNAPELSSPQPAHKDLRLARWINRLMTGVLGLCLSVTLGPLFFILSYLVFKGLGSLSWEFFVKLPTAIGEPGGGMANALVGSALLVGVATLMAVPVGLLAAIYLAEYSNRWLGPMVRFIGELLGGVPSIVVGIFAYTLIIQTSRLWFGRASWFGWAGAFALAVMMIPIVMRASEEALKLVPPTLRHASLALGASQWQTLLRITIPAALPAIVTAVFLSIARVVGETAPLLLTAGMNRFWPRSLSDYTPSLSVYIFAYADSGDSEWIKQAWATALMLLTLVMLLNFGIRILTGKRVVQAGQVV